MYDEPLIHWGIPGMKWGVRRKRSGGAKTSVRGKKISKSIKAPKRTPEQAKKFMADQRKKKVAKLKTEQHINDVKRTTNHLLTAYLVSTQSQRISEITAPYKNATSDDSYAAAYQNWLDNG